MSASNPEGAVSTAINQLTLNEDVEMVGAQPPFIWWYSSSTEPEGRQEEKKDGHEQPWRRAIHTKSRQVPNWEQTNIFEVEDCLQEEARLGPYH